MRNTMLAAHGIEMRACNRRPAAFPADFGESFGITRKEIVNCLLCCFGDVTQGMDADLEFFGRMACAPAIFAIHIHEWTEPPRLPADDRDHQRQSEHAGAGE